MERMPQGVSGGEMSAIDIAAEAVHKEITLLGGKSLTVGHIAVVMRLAMREAVPAKNFPPIDRFWDYTDHKNYGWNECRKEFLGE